MTDVSLAALLCVVQPQISDEPAWTEEHCVERAREFIGAGRAENVDPLRLVAISIYECNLMEHAELVDRKGRRAVAVDACPMGLRFTGRGFRNRRRMATRREIIVMSAALLRDYRKFCLRERRRDGSHGNHFFVGHYNWGYRVINTGRARWYPSNVRAIYDALRRRRPTGPRPVGRAKRLVRIIKRMNVQISEEAF